MILKKKDKIKKYTTPSNRVGYPSGTCISTERGIFYVKNQKRYRLISQRVADSWNFPRIIVSSEAAAAGLKISGKLGFREGTLINNLSDGKIYLISENKKRQLHDPKWLNLLNYDVSDALLVSHEEANLHEDGEPLN
jgi:hypothetical protein